MMTQSDEIVLLAMAISAVMGGAVVWIAVAHRALRKARHAVLPPAEITARFDRLETVLDSLSLDVERIGEAERFASRLLAAKPNGLISGPPREGVTPH